MSLSPKIKLYFGVISISFFPISFYHLSEKTHPLLGTFLIFLMVFILSLPAAIGEIIKDRFNSSFQSNKKINYFDISKITLRIWGILLLICTLTILGNLLVIYALSHQFSPSVVQGILRTETIFVTLGGIFIFKESYPRTLPWVIILLIIAFTIMGYETLIQRVWEWHNIYILHVLLAALCFSLFQILSKFIIHDLSVYFLNGIRSLINCLLILPWTYSYFHNITVEVILFAFVSALIGPFLGRNVILSCTRDLPLNTIGFNLSLTPIFSLGLQWLFIGTLPSNYEIIGGAIIILSVLIFNLSKK